MTIGWSRVFAKSSSDLQVSRYEKQAACHIQRNHLTPISYLDK